MKVCLLPKYGEENPYQILTLNGLERAGINAFFGKKFFYLSIIYNYHKYRPDWIHFDWIYFGYKVNLPLPFKWLFLYIFQVQLFYIKYFTKCKMAYTLHNVESHEPYHKKIDLLAQKSVFKKVDFIRVFSDTTKQKIKKIWSDNVDLDKFIRQSEGSYIDYYENKITDVDARTRFNLKEDDFVILFLGSIRKYKGVYELIEAFNNEKEENWKLLIAGYRYDKEYCDLIEKKVENNDQIQLFFGHQQNEDLQFYFNACDVVALPFKNIENSGSVILSMGFSKPILAPKLGVINDKLAHQEKLLFENSINESLRSIKKMYPDKLKKIGESNFEIANSYNWEHFANLFYKFS